MGSFAQDHDVIVVGAGVAGCKAALEASRQGSKVLLLEEHPQVGVPSHCSGVVSLKGLGLMGLDSHPSFSQRAIRGARLHPPEGRPVEIRRPEPVALIVNRMRFDQYLAKQAMAAGAELYTKTRVSRFERYKDNTAGVVLQDGQKIRGKVVIDASGAGSRLPEQAGLRSPDWSQLLPGLQYELAETEDQDDLVELFFGSQRAPGFFAWSIPTGRTAARVGLATKRGNVKKLLDELVTEHWPKAEIESSRSGSVLVSGPIDRCWSANFLVAGDAAGQVKQTTGGGIVIGGYCGMLAGRAASASAAAGEDESTHFLKEYDLKWRNKFGSDLMSMGLARKLFAGLSDETLNRLFLAVEPYLSEIEEEGDMDFQGRIITRLLRKRKLAGLLPRVAADSLRNIFA